MRRTLFSALLALTIVGPSNGESNLTLFGAPRASLDGVLPVLSIEEGYILQQTDGVPNTAFGAAGTLQCSASNPCADGSCCNSQGQCGFRDEHCKNNCVANCDATAPCGVNSKGGSQTCPLNVCCSYFGFCGATDSFCRDTTESGQSTPCQKQFGKCGTVSTLASPTCSKGSGTASRKVAYYEGWNTRRRPCDKVYPVDIDTTGLTHLVFSFATIDPTTFAVNPMHPDDEKLYADFLALKDGSRKWIGIGGWEFSDAGATRYTWSQMASTKANRDAFITSLLEFLDKWEFEGVDIDWEWPGAETRGGNPAIDMRNQIDLMVDLRKALGSRGLSVVMPAQYGYLKNIDPKALEAQVDFFNVLSYDLHGPWDATVPGEGAKIKPHTDLKEIDTALNLFWFNDVQPSKINLGIANYGRGHTVADASCAKYDCAWTGPSKAGECTQLEGVLSQCEIQRIIRAKHLSPEIIAGGAGVKQIVFDGQWVGYDDNETLGLKTELANNRCLGGTALWAIDYASCGGGDDGPIGPGAPQSSSAAPSVSAPGVSVAPSSAASSAPATSSAPVASSASASSAASSAFPPASSTTSQAESSAAPPTVVPIVPSVGSSAPASSTPTSSVSAPSAAASSSAWSTTSPSVSSTAPSTAPSSQASQAWSSTFTPTSSMAQVSSGASSATSSEAASSGAPPVVIGPSSGSLQSSDATTVTSSAASSAALSSSVASSQEAPATSLSSSSGSSAWTSSTASSSAPVSSSSSFASQSSSRATSTPGSSIVWASSPEGTTSTTSSAGSSTSDVSSPWLSVSTTTFGTTMVWASSSANVSSSTGTSPEQSSAAISSIAQSSQSSSGTTPPVASWSSSPSQPRTATGELSQSASQSSGAISESASSSQVSSNAATSDASSVSSWSATSSTGEFSGITSTPSQTSRDAVISSTAQTLQLSQWSSTAASSAATSSGTQAVSITITSSRTIPTSNASRTQTQDRTTDDDDGTTGVGPVFTKPNGDKPDPTRKPDPTKDPDDNNTKDPDTDPTSKPDSDPTSKPGSTTKSDPTNTSGGTAITPPGGVSTPGLTGVIPPATATPTSIPPGGGLMKGCVPNDCVADCAPWYAMTLLVLKRPWCPCKVVTCKPDDDKDDWSDSDSDGEDDDCGLFGCGCGWMGLPWGPGCDIDIKIPFPVLFPGGIFGPDPCKFFGGCPPGTGPPGDCGPFGCGGYCNIPGGCSPCPPEICSGPLCKIPTGCGPKTGPNPTPDPTRPTKCEEDQKTTVTEKLVHCTENIKLEPTTIKSINFTLTSTVTSTCLTPVLRTWTGCGIMGTSTTTTHSSFTTTSSSVPMCSRAPLDLDNDEGDNEQPHRTTDGPTCTRAPLSLDDDEGDNEQPTSSEAPVCTRAPLSLDDDEGNNEMPADMSSSLSMSFSPTPSANSSGFLSTPTPSANSSSIASASSTWSSLFSVSRIPPPSTLSMPSTTPPWGIGIPSGTPAPANCPTCDQYFTDCINYKCKQDGSDAESCAKWCLSALCYSKDSIDYCKKGCKPAACPKENPTYMDKGEPAVPFTTVLSLSSTTLTVTATPGPASPTPSCKSGGTISPRGKWTAYLEHEIKKRPTNATLTWKLWDENGCEANQGSVANMILGANISAEIGATNRPPDFRMGYMLHTNVTESTSSSRSEIEFVISKFPAGCSQLCWTKWKITNGLESKPWQLTDDCAQQCGMRKLEPTDVSCDDGINKFTDYGNDVEKRAGYCSWRMPFEPGNDNPTPPPRPFIRGDIWTADFVQWMEYEKSNIEWTLYDPRKEKAGYGWKDTSNADIVNTEIETQDRDDQPQDKMRYKMLLTVAHPRVKDDTTVKIAYTNGKLPGCKYSTEVIGMVPECQPSYQTESNDETKQSHFNSCYSEKDGVKYICPVPLLNNREFSCDKVPDAFYPKGAGFERKFKCWWPHDFVEGFGNMGSGSRGALEFGGLNRTSGALGLDGGVNGSWTNTTWRTNAT